MPATAHAPSVPTLIARLYGHFSGESLSTGGRVLLIVLLAIFVHLLIVGVTAATERILRFTRQRRLRFVGDRPKFATLVRLMANTFIWVVYFVAIGLFLEECGVNLTTYLASASVVGLAISFGSQGLVQDMVIGLTLIFSDAMDVDDMVEIVGSAVVVGRVQEIGLRFTKVLNLYNQVVFIPNRTVANVSRFPYGGIHAYTDVQLPDGVDRERARQTVHSIARGLREQFGGIVLGDPEVDDLTAADDAGWGYLRVRFVIWPGQGALLETTFRQLLLRAMKTFDPNYADWQVTVLYRAAGGPRIVHTAAASHAPAKPTVSAQR